MRRKAVVTMEYLLVATIVALGLVVGLSNLQIALDVELNELSNSITSLNQSYNIPTLITTNCAVKNGTCVYDRYEYQVISSSFPNSCKSTSVKCDPLAYPCRENFSGLDWRSPSAAP